MQHKKHKTSKNQLAKQKQVNTKQQNPKIFAHKNFIGWGDCLFRVSFHLKSLRKKNEFMLIASFTILLNCFMIVESSMTEGKRFLTAENTIGVTALKQ